MKLFCLLTIWLLLSSSSVQREQIKIVGSSTLYPFVTIAAEHFARKHQYKTPIVESIGTGAGIKLFCSGENLKYPDIANASRKIKDSEIDLCKKNNIRNFKEVVLGYDGVVIARSVKGINLFLSSEQLFLALAKYVVRGDKLVENPYNYWNEIDPLFEHTKIEIFGPAYGSGTRDAIAEIIADHCLIQKRVEILYPKLEDRKIFCTLIREDGKYIESSENDNIIISKIVQNQDALGIISYNYLRSNLLKIKAISLDNTYPTIESIVNQKYKLSRPLFLYVNQEHYNAIPHLQEFVREIQTIEYIGPDGILTKNGLIPNSN